MSKSITATGALFVLLAIIFGAMGAHAIEKHVSPHLVETFETGVKYQMYVGLGLLMVGLNFDKLKFNPNAFFVLNIFGVFFFSGFIYAYTFHEHIHFFKHFALIVPFGGTFMIIGWFILLVQLMRQK